MLKIPILFGCLIVASCASSTDMNGVPSSNPLAADDGGACNRVAGLDGGRCQVGRTVLSCTSPAAGEACISDSLTDCNDPANEADAGFVCESHCTDSEYGVACLNEIGVPDHCRLIFGEAPHPVTGGAAFWCCPCE